nr:alpha/beta hydrolase [Actinomycetales bacterium]
MEIVLIGGLWVDCGAWTRVAAQLGERGHRVTVPLLPGIHDDDASATFESH